MSLMTIINSSWDLSSLVEVGGGKIDLEIKFLVFAVSLISVFLIEHSKYSSKINLSGYITNLRFWIIISVLFTVVTVSTILRLHFPSVSSLFYRLFGVNQLDLRYADMDYFVKTTSCPGNFRVGDLISCEETSLVYLYPSGVIRFMLDFLDLRKYVDVLQLFQLSLFVGAVFLLCRMGTQMTYWLVLLLVASPQMQLLLERGNVDLFVLTLTIFACLAFAQKKRSLNWIGFFCICLGALLKFYLLPAVIVGSIVVFRYRDRLYAIGIAILFSIWLVPEILLSSYSSINELKGTFGLQSLIYFVNGRISTLESIPNLISLCISLLLCTILFFSGYYKARIMFGFNQGYTPGVLVLVTIFLSVWFFTNSYHYKLVFLTVAFIFLIRDLKIGKAANQNFTFLVFLNILALLAYRETFFLVSNVVIVFCCGLFAFVFTAKLSQEARVQILPRFL
jgi:hypothetical protein